jgi:hypothetical protein
MRPVRLALLAALALTATAAPAVAAESGADGPRHLPDAEIFATSNTAVITDPADPRLDDRLTRFARQVRRIIRAGGGVPRRSTLLDGVFFDAELGTTTFERSRDFDVDSVTPQELEAIAERIRVRFRQGSVLTFDYLFPLSPRVDAVEIVVPGVDAARLREALLADEQARERLFGGSVTVDGRLLLVAALEDLALARDLVQRIGGDWERGAVRFGDREFVGS